jgi:hypothetical protein
MCFETSGKCRDATKLNGHGRSPTSLDSVGKRVRNIRYKPPVVCHKSLMLRHGAGKGNRSLIAITKFFAGIRCGCCGHGVTIGFQRMLS